MRRLLVYQAIWGMEALAGVDLENGMEAAVDRICAAGFDGVGVSLLREPRARAVASLIRDRGKSWEATSFIRTREDFARGLDQAQELGAHHLNVQILTRPERVAEAVALFESLEAEAQRATIPVYYETHRARITNDLIFVTQVLRELPNLRLTGDLSHYAVANEMSLPVSAIELERMSHVIEQCWNFHGRIAGSHQVQIPIAAPQHAGWVQQFHAWWAQGFASWLRRAGTDADLCFMPELGPPNYAITDVHGRELSDRWSEALTLKDVARRLWSEANAEVR